LADTIQLKLKETLGKEVILRPYVDPQVKGGFVLRVGDKVVDASVKARLRDLRGRMIGIG
ncbi:MAG: F0F1 ATP synthase subunit delta, partial [Chloroflexi bacterium]|nr:F0F1 ATP synthase subunit delta [Chloroflexota bacterium]